MRYLILSDVHGNWDALQAVLRQVRRKRFDATLVLGDLVGYGASPNRVVDAMAELPGSVSAVRGNHDKVVAGLAEGSEFNEAALASAEWTREKLTPQNLTYLQELVKGPIEVEAGANGVPTVAICHGSPADEDTYLFSEMDAWAAFRAPPAALLTFFGHTHLPSVFALHADGIQGILLKGQGSARLEEGARYLVNPGSVGQPRDRNPYAAYMTYDSERRMLHWRRLRYPIDRAQGRILAAGLPELLAERLSWGV